MVRLDALILAVIWLLVGCQQQAKDALVDVVGTAQGLVEPTELKGWIDAGSSVFIMDVRPIASYKQGHIPGSVQLWRNAYAERLAVLRNGHPAGTLSKVAGFIGTSG